MNIFDIRSKKGSTLIWVLIVMMVLGLLITAGFAIVTSYTNRSITQHNDKQSYYTALSTTKSIAEWLGGTSDENADDRVEQLQFINSLKSATNKEITFDSTVDDTLGTCSTKVTYDTNSESIRIASTAEYNGESTTVKASLASTTIGSGSSSADSEIKLITPPKTTPAEAYDDSNSEELSDREKRNAIKRDIEINFKNDKFYSLGNTLAPHAYSAYTNQYYLLDIKDGQDTDNVFLKLKNGNFPKIDANKILQNRNMVVYNGDVKIKGKNNSFTIYTEEKKQG